MATLMEPEDDETRLPAPQVDSREVLKMAVQRGLGFYLKARVNKYGKRIQWIKQVPDDREPLGRDVVIESATEADRLIDEIVDYAMDEIMNEVDAWFHFD